MKLYTCYSPSHEVLFREHFLPSVKLSGLDLQEPRLLLQRDPEGRYGTSGFKATCYDKLDWISKTVEKEVMAASAEGRSVEPFVYSDVDVRFYGRVVEDLIAHFSESGSDVYCQWDGEHGLYCTGFMYICPSPVLLDFLEVCLSFMLYDAADDQQAFNHIQAGPVRPFLCVEALPARYWTFGRTNRRWEPGTRVCPPPDLLMHHANWTVGVPNKIALLNEVAREHERRVFEKWPRQTPAQLMDDVNEMIDRAAGLKDGGRVSFAPEPLNSGINRALALAAEPSQPPPGRLTLAQKLAGECTCHLSPPCAWCTSLTEEETDAFARGGVKAAHEVMEREDENLQTQG